MRPHIVIRQAVAAAVTDKESDATMIQYKYLIGDKISFVNQDRTRTAASGNYRIVARRPVSDGEPQYVIKSDQERYDRVVAESDLQ